MAVALGASLLRPLLPLLHPDIVSHIKSQAEVQGEISGPQTWCWEDSRGGSCMETWIPRPPSGRPRYIGTLSQVWWGVVGKAQVQVESWCAEACGCAWEEFGVFSRYMVCQFQALTGCGSPVCLLRKAEWRPDRQARSVVSWCPFSLPSSWQSSGVVTGQL